MTDAAADLKEFERLLAAQEERLGAPKGSIVSLVHESDWTLIIKAHALIESSVSHAVVSGSDARFKSILSKLPLGHENNGKLAFAKALGVINPEQIRFIKQISKIRNALAHNAAYLAFELKSYVAELDPGDRKTFFNDMPFGIETARRPGWIEMFEQVPQIGIIRGTMALVSQLVTAGEMARIQREKDQFYRELLEDAQGSDAPAE